MPVGTFFELPTVAQLAARIDELAGKAPQRREIEAIDDLLTEIESLSNEEAEQLLESERRALG
jgi:hypothetical protein